MVHSNILVLRFESSRLTACDSQLCSFSSARERNSAEIKTSPLHSLYIVSWEAALAVKADNCAEETLRGKKKACVLENCTEFSGG